MAGTMFMRVEEVAEEMDVSVSYANKLIRRLNKELKATGCISIPGRIDRRNRKRSPPLAFLPGGVI